MNIDTLLLCIDPNLGKLIDQSYAYWTSKSTNACGLRVDRDNVDRDLAVHFYGASIQSDRFDVLSVEGQYVERK